MMDKIDFVVLWVDGDDPAWQEERARYMPQKNTSANSCNRYRDWDLMKYWFRGIEKFAPWVNKVYFVTCGHYPKWLNLEHPKLVPVKHSDYIPQECLPTYNSNVIELYLNRLPQLSEQFVLLNDDMFLLKPAKETDFFRDGVPCETARLGQVQSSIPGMEFPHAILNNSAILNKYFSKKKVMRKYWNKFFSLKYGKDLFRNLLLYPFEFFSAFYDTHLPTSHLKSTFDEIWEKEPDILNNCGKHRFRTNEDVTHWLMKCWRICQGRFVPRSTKWGKCFEIGADKDIAKAIVNQKYKVVCLNDSNPNLDFDAHQKELIEAFEQILPEKSGFEK